MRGMVRNVMIPVIFTYLLSSVQSFFT